MGNDPRAVRMRVEALEKVLERAFHIPGTKIPVGLDTVIGLVPVLGDLVTAAMGAYILGRPQSGHVKMAAATYECEYRY